MHRNTDTRAASARVILIGGAPLSGKTAAARLIGRQCGMPVISTDHLGEAARAVTTPSSNADLHVCTLIDSRDYYASRLPEQLFDDALRRALARDRGGDPPPSRVGWLRSHRGLGSPASPGRDDRFTEVVRRMDRGAGGHDAVAARSRDRLCPRGG